MDLFGLGLFLVVRGIKKIILTLVHGLVAAVFIVLSESNLLKSQALHVGLAIQIPLILLGDTDIQ